ncbi:MAG: hypothetical protein K8I00_12220 [Candidatus Omnitrophica bacterium]|nr:hypothetical protein [Candidatus Omnitrophota bacterium]
MAFKELIQKLKYWDHLAARWLMRHFYFTFFQLVLLVIFVFWFRNLLNVIDINLHQTDKTFVEAILTTQNVNTSILVVLLLLNSFWMLYILNALQRLANLIKDVSYNINRLRSSQNRKD